MELTDEQFDALFDSFTSSTFRLETLPQYLVSEEDEEFRRFLEGHPPPVRTPQTSPWLRRIADSTAAGRRWRRVHIVSHPLTTYLRYELACYPDNARAGEDIRIADRDAHPELAALNEDFWLFDADMSHACAALMRYGPQGHYLGAVRTDDPTILDRCRQQRDLALACSVPLADYPQARR